MIAGTRPFPEAQTAVAALAAMLKTTPEPLYLRAPVPEELDRIVMRCLERETAQRYQNVVELRADLNQLLDGTATGRTTSNITTRPVEKQDEATTFTPPPESWFAARGASRRSRPSSRRCPRGCSTSREEIGRPSRRRPRHPRRRCSRRTPREAAVRRAHCVHAAAAVAADGLRREDIDGSSVTAPRALAPTVNEADVTAVTPLTSVTPTAPVAPRTHFAHARRRTASRSSARCLRTSATRRCRRSSPRRSRRRGR